MVGHSDLDRPSAWHFWEGAWVSGNPGIMGPMTHGAWMASTVFDGARAVEGLAPDLDRHCARLIASAQAMDLDPPLDATAVVDRVKEGIDRFRAGTPLYIRPMIWAESGFVAPEPESARLCITLIEAALPSVEGLSVCLSGYRRPTPESAPTDAKAACLYPNSGRALRAARKRGFDNAVLLDALGNVAELATANIAIVKDGEVITPSPNGSFLNGITKQRVMSLLAHEGLTVTERRLTWTECTTADEIFSTGNHGKVIPIRRIEDRDIPIGPISQKARALYWAWARETGKV